MRRLGQWLRALISLVGMVAVLGGTPWALIVWVGNPIPPEGLAWNADLTDNSLIGLLAVVVWVIWAQLLIGTVAALVEEIRGVDIGSLPGVLGSQRDLARRAIAALAVVVVSSTAVAASASAVTAPRHAAATSPLGAQDGPQADREAAAQALRDDLRLATVTQEQSDLWTIAEKHLGDGQRWTEIRELNQGRMMVDGRTFRSANLLQPGWKLLMPPDAKNLPLASAAAQPSAVDDTRVSYIVRSGDNLSAIAQRFLGDASRYGEIFDLNAGRQQPDGRSLTDPDEIWPGWSLRIPNPDHVGPPVDTDAPADDRPADRPTQDNEQPSQDNEGGPDGAGTGLPPAEQRAQSDREQRSAEREQPPAEREQPPAERHHAESEEPRQETEQADPDKEQVVPPVTTPRDETERITPRGEPPRQEAEPAPTQQSEPAPAEGDETASSASEDESGVPVLAVAGVGAVTAAGLLGLLRLRRTWQRARRKPGQRVPEAETWSLSLEETLSTGADVAGVDLVDGALRGLLTWCGDGGNGGVLPVIQFARLTELGVELYLAEPAELPDPWRSLHGETAWTLARDAEGYAGFNDGGMAPYPALVYLGDDPEGGEILVDLEFLGTLDLEGPADETERMLAALTTGLATSQWADHVDVTIVGTHPGLERELRTGRVRYLPEVGDLLSDLAVRAREDAAAWSELEVGDVTEARVQRQSEASGLFVPEIVLLAVEVTPEQREQLASLLEDLPRVAVAAVTTDAGVGQWRLRPDPDTDTEDDTDTDSNSDASGAWVLDPVGLRLNPARLDDETYARVLELLRAADREPEGEPVRLAEPVATLDAKPAPYVPTQPTGQSPPLPAPVPTAGEFDAGLDDESEASPPAEPTPEARAQEAVNVRSTFGLNCPPVIDNLGPPRVTYPAVEIPENRLPRVLAFLCYIAENRGCSHEQLDEAMFPGARVNPDTRTRYINYARTLLGKGANGMDYLPRRSYTDLSEEVVTTWDLFHNLVGDDPFNAPTDSLERALSLVRGRPYEGGKAAWYGWSEHSARRMYDLIADTACALADRRYSAGQWRAAVDAAIVGWSIEPVQQWLWRVHIQGLRALGDVDEARRIAVERNSFSEELEFELEPDTARIFDELGIFDSYSYAR